MEKIEELFSNDMMHSKLAKSVLPIVMQSIIM